MTTSASRDEPRALAVLTSVIWTSVLAAGVVGGMLRYARPAPPAKIAPPVIAQSLTVELTEDAVSPISKVVPAAKLLEPPPLAPQVPLPSPPPEIAVAAPSPAIAFAVPIQAPAKIVEAAQASYRTTELTQKVEAAAPQAIAPQPLTYGMGEGKQPAPEYPRLARRQGQEGVVVVRMSVAADGRIVAAEASSPSPWPLLNESALRVVRQRWRFSAGMPRLFEVAIRFQLNRSNL